MNKKQPEITDKQINEITLDTVLDVFHFVSDKENFMILESMPGITEYIADNVGIDNIQNLEKRLKELKQNELVSYNDKTKTYRLTKISKNTIKLIKAVSGITKKEVKERLKKGG